jgi:MOSC domain-containing protein YiiM
VSSLVGAAEHATYAQLQASLGDIRAAPRDSGTLDLIVRRPVSGAREVLDRALLDRELGLVGDRWSAPGAARNREEQITLMCSRVVDAIARGRARWPLAGDQLYVDLDLSAANVPPGTRLAIGEAVIEVSPYPHLPCKKFRARYGLEAARFVGAGAGRELQMRGINAWVVEPAEVRCGDLVRKL